MQSRLAPHRKVKYTLLALIVLSYVALILLAMHVQGCAATRHEACLCKAEGCRSIFAASGEAASIVRRPATPVPTQPETE